MKLLISAVALMAIFLVASSRADVYDHDLALRLMFYAGINKCNHSEVVTWTCPGCVQNVPGAEFIGLLGANPQDNFGFVAVDHSMPDGPMIVVSFRGSSNIKNWVENFQIWFDKKTFQNLTNVRIHTGFYDGWYDSRKEMHTFVAEALAKYPNATIAVTGHSLGGALSEVYAVDFATTEVIGELRDTLPTYPPHPIYRKVIAYNFGTPRVGDDGWAALVHGVVFSYFRLTHDRDIVPMIPPKGLGFDYMHPPTEVWFEDQDGDHFKVCDDDNGEDPTCINSRVIPSFTEDHGQYLGRDVGCTCPILPPKKH